MEQCTWPSLEEPYRTALREAVGYIFARFRPTGIVVTGTFIRGDPGPTSDLDFHVLHGKPERQRVQRFFHGVPAEVFVNPLEQVHRYFATERSEGRPVTAHMYATGVAVFDPDGLIKELQAAAAEVLAQGPDPSSGFLVAKRYAAATWLEDALDVAPVDPDTCSMLLAKAVEGAVHYRFWAARRWQPRPKETLLALADLDPKFAHLVRQFHRASEVEERVRVAHEVVHRSVGVTGFFEWESDSKPVNP